MGARDVVFSIIALDRASAVLERVGLTAGSTGSKFGKFGKLAGATFDAVALGAGAAAVAGVKMASDFQSTMEQLHTQAGVSQKSTDALGKSVLDLAGKVGTNPDSLADALYHVESSFASTGIKGPQAMHLLTTAAEGAKVGHANLTDVTNALDAAVVSGIPGVKNFDQAMGMLNATVGSGDMRMQDLAEAFGGGNIAAVKTYGLSLKDVGAALALFGDNNIRGAAAGTQLRMAVQGFAKPSATGAEALKKLGLQSDTMAKAMAHGGLNEAMKVLTDHITKAGIKGDEVGGVLTQAFGKKAGTGINVLVDQFGRLQSKYDEIQKGAGNFGSAWAAQQKTFKQQWDQLKATIDSLLIQLGTKLIPVIQSVVGFMVQHKTATLGIVAAVGTLIGLLAAFGLYLKITQAIKVATELWKGAQLALNFVMEANPVGLIIVGIALLIAGIVMLWQHSQTFRTIVTTAWDAVKTGALAAVHAIVAAWDWLKGAFTATVNWFKALPGRIWAGLQALPGLLWTLFKTAVERAAFAFGYGVGMLLKLAIELPGKIWSALTSLPGLIWGLITSLATKAAVLWLTFNAKLIALVATLASDVGHWFSTLVSNAVSFLATLPGRAVAFVSQLPGKIKGAVSDAGSWLLDAGRQVVMGLVNGLKNAAGAAISAVKDLGSNILSGFKSAMGIASPSKAMAILGAWIPPGIAEGIKSTASVAANALTAPIKAALATAKSLVSEASKLAADTAKGVIDGGDISKTEGGFYGILQSLQDRAGRASMLGTVLTQLRKAGLDGTSLSQLANGGIDSLGNAQQILASGPAGIRQIAALQAQVVASAKAMGKGVADAMYGAQIAASNNQARMLQAQQSRLAAIGHGKVVHNHFTITSGFVGSPEQLARAFADIVKRAGKRGT